MARAKTQNSDLQGSELLAAASHEIKTPLTTVSSIASALHNGLFGRLSNEQKQQLKRIELTSTRLLKVVDGLLGLEKLKEGRLELQREPVNVLAIAKAVVDELRPLAKDAKQEVRLLRTSLPPVIADQTFVHQVLFNLIHNALKYSPEGSVVTITAQLDGNIVSVIVSDQAPRLSSEDRKLLFTKFSPLSSRSAMPGSNGLGLYLASSIVTLLGGNLQHHTGKSGNRFHLRLPKSEQLVLFEGELQ